MARDFVGEAWIGFFHARNGGLNVRVTLGAAFFDLAHGFNPVTKSIGSGPMYAMVEGEAEAFDGDGFLHTGWIDASIVENDDAAEGMPDEANREIVDDIQQRGEIEHMFGGTIHRARGPAAITMATQIERINVILVGEGSCYPIPIAGVVEGAVHEDERGLVVLAIVPKLQLKTVGVKEVRDGFHFFPDEAPSWARMKEPAPKIHGNGALCQRCQKGERAV